MKSSDCASTPAPKPTFADRHCAMPPSRTPRLAPRKEVQVPARSILGTQQVVCCAGRWLRHRFQRAWRISRRRLVTGGGAVVADQVRGPAIREPAILVQMIGVAEPALSAHSMIVVSHGAGDYCRAQPSEAYLLPRGFTAAVTANDEMVPATSTAAIGSAPPMRATSAVPNWARP